MCHQLHLIPFSQQRPPSLSERCFETAPGHRDVPDHSPLCETLLLYFRHGCVRRIAGLEGGHTARAPSPWHAGGARAHRGGGHGAYAPSPDRLGVCPSNHRSTVPARRSRRRWAALVQSRLACLAPDCRRAPDTDRRTFSRTSLPHVDTRCSQSASAFKVRKRLAGVA